MRVLQYLLILVFTLGLSSDGFAYDFKHLKLKGELFKKNSSNQSRNMKGNNASTEKNEDNTKLPPILEEISKLLGSSYQEVGKTQTDALIKNHNLGGGVYNFSGYSWYKPMGKYDLKANREVAPELFSERWIVHDTLTISIDASTLLTNYKDSELIEISSQDIGAFAGITFKRTYHYYHFSDSYLKGLKSDFSKLFLSFNHFTQSGALNLSDYEILKKTDVFSFNAGGLIKVPSGSGVSVTAGVLIQTAYKNEVLIQGIAADEQSNPDEFLRLSINQLYNKKSAAQISLQYDFFNLLKLTLFSYDFEYEYEKSNKSYLSFYQSDKSLIISDSLYSNEFKKLLRGRGKVKLWEGNITSMEQRSKENLTSKYNFLLLGQMTKRATEQIKIVKDGIQKTFFKHYSETVKYIQSFLSQVFSKLVNKLFKFSTIVTNKVELRKQLSIEYEQMKELKPATVDSTEKFSMQLKQFFYVASTTKWYEKSLWKSAKHYTKNLTTLSQVIIDKVGNKELVGPITINSTIEVERAGLDYFSALKFEEVEPILKKICKVKKVSYVWRIRAGRRRRVRVKNTNKCFKKITDKYLNYREYYISSETINLNLLKKFIGVYYSNTQSINQFYPLFGEDNIFIYGDFKAKTKSGIPFQTFFKKGEFRGLGVIDKFKRSQGITPINTDTNQ